MKTHPTIRSLRVVALVLGLAFAGCSSNLDEEEVEHSQPPVPIAVPTEHAVHVTARRFEYQPATIHLKRGEPALLEFTTLDCTHGFEAARLGLSAKIEPGVGARLRFTPTEAGRFPFHCNVFCGDGHEEMEGEIVVDE